MRNEKYDGAERLPISTESCILNPVSKRRSDMKIIDWAAEIARILAWIAEHRVAYAEITLTVKGGKVVFVDYRGPIRQNEE